ncbi:A24 family peptidase [Erythrobacter mangrovi]|uniref:Prepilin peptidase n=1 Tax=Erythrobacter mangrovi TaxID=2739433 RepID=A0A7D3XQ00_9SPHN|nr:prepilin peptidase [Erythrobacter mangrovi]QKG71134.1 prepilin peptidase [Erythrobacter mangrovi]
MAAEIALALAVAIGLTGAVWDVRTRRIPNLLVLPLAVAAVGATVLGADWSVLGSTALHAAIALVVGMLLFAGRLIGAGDAKFYAAAALAIPLDRALPMLGWVALSGLALVALMTIWYRGLKITRNGERQSWTLPYAVPIFCGFLAESWPRLEVVF